MSKYTTQLRYVIETFANSPNASISQKIDLSLPKIFNFPYPIWEQAYKPTLERKIVLHYFTKEIAFEVLGLWQLYLEERLNLIMPYYNQRYKTVSREFDYLKNIDLTEEFSATELATELRNLTGDEITTLKSLNVLSRNFDINSTDTSALNSQDTTNGTSEKSGTNESNNLESDLPQANYAGLDYGTKLTEFAGTTGDTETVNNTLTRESTSTNTNKTTNVQDENADLTNNGTLKSTNKIDGKQDKNNSYSKVITGMNGNKTFTELMLEFRNSLINIDREVVEELNDLFMKIY